MQDQSGTKNMSDVTIKTIKGEYDTSSFTKQQIRKYKRYEKDIFHEILMSY